MNFFKRIVAAYHDWIAKREVEKLHAESAERHRIANSMIAEYRRVQWDRDTK